ncbi:LysR substrate-binding domain-containing protein [Pseudoalteromonas denitrificans]|uniref:DNA-binding transcriptional regulator, LysR family n=1 Tax=Pseudoalteromonas denitrificans DSM 6059 TaxID=1123010 RepID=A0A1I1MT97_9GAMM|nr:LysR substrate-binding domain-containing protein [Pseudoalteromonas denitrificans]SFC88581.1 DNA-binding transcriptional regulator, LysR family [Pseudoalteromonas denitrificans DSM 6059]
MLLNAQILAALRTFDAAARHQNFTQASKELCITAGAVSQQMTNLEAQLKLVLFERHSRGINLTKDGKKLFEVVQPSLNSISQTIEQMQTPLEVNKVIRVKSTPSFTYKWLVPKLQDFYQQYPHIKIQLFADAALVDKSKTDYDLIIDFGPIPYLNLPTNIHCELLMSETLTPVMSPNYAEKLDLYSQIHWENMTLLHDAMPWSGTEPDHEWRYWFNMNNLSDVKSNTGHYFNRTDLAIEAAIAGQGIALARKTLITKEIVSGKLIAPVRSINANSGYYLLHPIQKEIQLPNNDILLFKNWLKSQAQSWLKQI